MLYIGLLYEAYVTQSVNLRIHKRVYNYVSHMFNMHAQYLELYAEVAPVFKNSKVMTTANEDSRSFERRLYKENELAMSWAGYFI